MKSMSPYYRTCPYCGAHLDPGERCDCQRKIEMTPEKFKAQSEVIHKIAEGIREKLRSK